MKKIILVVLILGLFLVGGCKKEQGIKTRDNITEEGLGWVEIESLINCSELIQKVELVDAGLVDSLSIKETFNIIGCVLTEFHNKTPKITDEILNKYYFIVSYESFDISK